MATETPTETKQRLCRELNIDCEGLSIREMAARYVPTTDYNNLYAVPPLLKGEYYYQVEGIQEEATGRSGVHSKHKET